MRAVMISDTHFGDPNCALVKSDGAGGYVAGDKMQEFIQAAGRGNDYLILIGDIFDFSIVSYEEAYKAAKSFFDLLLDEGGGLLAQGGAIIYQPGNHDFSFWHWAMHEVSAVRPISARHGDGLPRPSRFTVPGVIDMRSKGAAINGLHLHGVSRQEGGDHPYGGLFLDHLTRRRVPFYVTYPNLYLLTDEESILVTHGQYWDSLWASFSEYGPRYLGDDLHDEDGRPLQHPLQISELVALNFPLNVFMSSAIGQAGEFTQWIRRSFILLRDAPDLAAKKLSGYVERILSSVDMNALLRCAVLWYLRRRIRRWVKEAAQNEPRNNSDYPSSRAQRTAFKHYFDAAMREIEGLNATPEFAAEGAIPRPTRLIFGHTHVPVPWSDAMHNHELGLTLCNSGGWLYREEDGERSFVGAEVFLLRDGTICSVSLRD